MGWKTKIVFLLIIYFAGFATAIYYLAPADSRQCQAAEYSYNSGNSGNSGAYQSQNAANTGGRFKELCEKAYAKAAASFNNMDTEQFKAAYDRGMKAIKEMAKNSQNTNTTAEGAEDK
jgi:hypothetical protein